jgi:hypothetical protein
MPVYEGGKTLHGWNVVVTTREKGFVLACELLEKFGTKSKPK